MKAQTPKGFRDFLPKDALKRQIVIGKITETFKKFGFDPLETPTLEFEETLTGKYGEEEKLIYKFETPGGDKVALKYDQTVPLARVVAQYPELPKPFKRYQIQSAYRGENTQKGRYREFLQCDADIIGVSTPLADAEILALVYEIYQNLGLDIVIKINDRSLMSDIEPKYLMSIDKLNKIGPDGVLAELVDRGMSSQSAQELLQRFSNQQINDALTKITKRYLEMGYPEDSYQFDPTLVRGLSYYTGLILEVVLKSNPTGSSLCGGGRYDNLIGMFMENQIPAVGFAIGLDRTIEAMEEASVIDPISTNTQALVTIFNTELSPTSLTTLSALRKAGISSEIYLDPEAKLDKQLKYADNKGIPYVIIIGPDEAKNNTVTLKNFKEKTQITDTIGKIIAQLT